MFKKSHLKEYCKFLLKEENLQEAVRLNIQFARNHASGLLKTLEPLSDEKMEELFKVTFGKFIKDLSEGKGLDNIIGSFNQWKANNYGLQGAITPTDIILAFMIRKDVLIQLIPTFTDNHGINLSIRDELDAFFLIASKTGMQYTGGV